MVLWTYGRNRLRTACILCVALVSIGAAGCAATSDSTPSGSMTGSSSQTKPERAHKRFKWSRVRCQAPSDPLAGVYHPSRLRLLAACRRGSGTVARVRHETDGDLHVDVMLDGSSTDLLNDVNRSKQAGQLVVEFMARDGGHLPGPSVGDRITLTGAWVNDADHGWNELHPVWSVQLNGGPISRSGPQYGGSPPTAGSRLAAADCRDQNHNV